MEEVRDGDPEAAVEDSGALSRVGREDGQERIVGFGGGLGAEGVAGVDDGLADDRGDRFAVDAFADGDNGRLFGVVADLTAVGGQGGSTIVIGEDEEDAIDDSGDSEGGEADGGGAVRGEAPRVQVSGLSGLRQRWMSRGVRSTAELVMSYGLLFAVRRR
ncbi:MAG TPA: hypothetical protein VFZ12_04465 [Dehalococcoidia bacterium]|nr:hypothetical protein [Dehalococcoidia bacterium]